MDSIDVHSLLTRVNNGYCAVDLQALLSVGNCQKIHVQWPGDYSQVPATEEKPNGLFITLDAEIAKRHDVQHCTEPIEYKPTPNVQLDVADLINLDLYLSLLDDKHQEHVTREHLLRILADLDIDGLLSADLDLNLDLGLGKLLSSVTTSDLQGLLGGVLGGLGDILGNLLNLDLEVGVGNILDLIVQIPSENNGKTKTLAVPKYSPHCGKAIKPGNGKIKTTTVPSPDKEHCLTTCQQDAARSTIGLVAELGLLNLVDIDLCLAIDLFTNNKGESTCTYRVGPKDYAPITEKELVSEEGHESYCVVY